MNVLVLTRYEQNGASSRTRHYNFRKSLADQGITLTFAPFLSAKYLECLYGAVNYSKINFIRHYSRRLMDVLQTGQYDLVWCEKEIFPYIPAWFEKLVLSKTIPVVLDFDDAWWLCYRNHSNGILRAVLGKKFESVIKNAAAITASNDLLLEDIESMGGKNTRLVPVALPIDDYAREGGRCTPNLDKRLKVGWIGTPITADLYLPMIANTLNRLVEEDICEVHLIGAGDAVPQLNARRFEWSEQNEISLIASHDVGIMPLLDDEFSNRKSAYKLLQYMACGRPIIGSPNGTNRYLFEGHEGNILGFSAENEEQWYSVIQYLAENPNQRIVAGEFCQAYVRTKHSVELQAEIIASVFSHVVR